VGTIALRGEANPSAAVRAALERSHAAGHDWHWILEDAEPEDGALQALLAVAEELPGAMLLAPRVLDAGGRLRFFREWPRYGDVAAIAAAAEHAALPLRAAGFAGLLLADAAIGRHGLPLAGDAGWRADWEYTARILRDDAGYLVPAAAVRLAPGADRPDRATAVRNALWTARAPAWTPRERLDRHVQLAVDVVRSHRRAAAVRGVLAGLAPGPR
jgi:hypothetical protein